MSIALTDGFDLSARASFRTLFASAWQPQSVPPVRRVVRREIPAEQIDAEIMRVRDFGALPDMTDSAYEAERWDGLG